MLKQQAPKVGHMFKFHYLLLSLLMLGLPVMADEDIPYEQQPGNSINEIALPLTKHTAAELAKIETGGKILSVDEQEGDNSVIFRVKVLHNNGKVKVHKFNRDTGHAAP
jgi:membrane-associated protease RseP (regulator of RpoE activity)